MADNRAKWQEARASILNALDILAEYERFGIRIISRQANAKGWIPAHAIDREDKRPSAGINIGDGPLRGRYKDFAGTQQTCSFFEFALKHGKFGGSWKAMIVYYARQTNVRLPDGDDEADCAIEPTAITKGVLYHYANGKQGVSMAAMERFGALSARWPRKAAAENINHLIAYPQYGSALLDMDPTGYHATATNPTQMVRVFQGKDNPPKLTKTVQLGDYGLMNVAGLSRLPNAEVVVFFEGITDGLCGEEKCPQDGKYSVLTCGGASYYLKPEWLHHFVGKEFWICMDVGDADDAGQIAAAVNVSRLVAAGITVRNIKLPQPAGGGKMDFRQWMNDGHSWEDFVEYAKTFEPAKIEDVEGQLSPHEALLLKLGITVIGEHPSSHKIEVYSDQTRKSQTIYDIDKLSYAKLTQLVGFARTDEHVNPGRDPVAGKSQLSDVKNAIASAASTKTFVGDEQLGAGVWSINGKIVLVGRDRYSIIKPSPIGVPKLTEQHSPFYDGKVLDTHTSVAWYDHGNVSRMLLQANDDVWCRSSFEEAVKLFSNWNWKYSPTPRILAAMIGCSYLQSIWSWRPGVAITGSTDSGKSMLMNTVLKEGIFGPMALYIQKPSEAAIRQHMRHHSRILLLDEFEYDANRPAVLRLLRVASSGGEIPKGTQDQKGIIYRLRHLVWVTAIELGMKDHADLNRYIFCELNEIPAAKRGNFRPPAKETLYDLGQRMMVIGIRHHRLALQYAEMLKGQQFPGVPGRLVEVFAVPCGMISAIYGHDEATAVGYMGMILDCWDFGGQRVKDEVRLLEEIFTAEVSLDGGRRMSVTQLLADPGGSNARAALQRVGLSRVIKRKDRGFDGAPDVERLFISQEVVKGRLLNKGSFAQQQIEQYLLRLEGAIRDRQRLGGDHAVTGVSVPMATIDKLLEKISDIDSEESEFVFD